MEDHDFIFQQHDGGKITSGGYTLNTTLNNGQGVMITNSDPNSLNQNGGALTNVLKDLAVPAGLFYLQQNLNKATDSYDSAHINKKKSKGNKYSSDNVISENLFDKLLGMVHPDKKKILDVKTRKRRISKNKKTRKVRK